MRNLALRRIGVARARDRNGIAARRPQHAAVGGLPARGSVKHGAVENDATRVGQADDGGAAFLQIGIVAEQAVGCHGTMSQHTGSTLYRMALSRSCAAPAIAARAALSRAGTAG